MLEKYTFEELHATPFKDVAIPYDEAITLLSELSLVTRKENLVQFARDFYPERAEEMIKSIDGLLRDHKPGGYILEQQDIESIYNKAQSEGVSLGGILEYFLYERIPSCLYPAPEPQSGVASLVMGIILDLANLVDSKVIDRDSIYLLISNLLKKSNKLTPFFMGSVIDDIRRRKGSMSFPIDYVSNREEVEKFTEIYFENLSEREKLEYTLGLKSELNLYYF